GRLVRDRGLGPGVAIDLRDAVHTARNEHGCGGARPDERGPAAAPAGLPATDQAFDVGPGRGQHLCLPVEHSSELLGEIHAPSTASAMPAADMARRIAAIAADDCDFTVPGAQPSTPAICASVMSS